MFFRTARSTRYSIVLILLLVTIVVFQRQLSKHIHLDTAGESSSREEVKMLDTIYIVRHGFRSNWAVSPHGEYKANIKSPTGIENDPPLVAHGVDQAVEMGGKLMTVDPPVERIFSSPFYRCLQTLKPFVDKTGMVIAGVEGGLSEWFGKAPFEHPSPASATLLHGFFPQLDTTYHPAVTPATRGESMAEVHDRAAFTLQRLIDRIDHEWETTKKGPRSILLCSHAATSIAMGRALVGDENFDVKVGTCSLSVYKRRPNSPARDHGVQMPALGDTWDVNKEKIPVLPWRGGKGVGGGWDSIVNGDCSHLKNGEERNWWFDGDEAWDFPLKKDDKSAAVVADGQQQAKI